MCPAYCFLFCQKCQCLQSVSWNAPTLLTHTCHLVVPSDIFSAGSMYRKYFCVKTPGMWADILNESFINDSLFFLAWSHYVCEQSDIQPSLRKGFVPFVSQSLACVHASMLTEIDIHPQVIREGLIERDYRGVLDRLQHWKWNRGVSLLSYRLPYFTTVMSSVWVWLTACINRHCKSPYRLFACPLALPEHILTPTHLFSAQKCFFGRRVVKQRVAVLYMRGCLSSVICFSLVAALHVRINLRCRN